jgi:hypothetical protein
MMKGSPGRGEEERTNPPFLPSCIIVAIPVLVRRKRRIKRRRRKERRNRVLPTSL